jgi:two-component sensor histidine kinase
VIGVLQAVDAEVNRFSTADLKVLESLAATVAIAIENARLYEQARQDAETKAMLLQEVNHRVKNNLAAIIGLLYAERYHASVDDQATYQAIIQDLIGRVQGLATVHTLLSATNWAPLPINELINRVIHASLRTIPSDKRVSVDVSPSSVEITPKQANNLALIINELVTNSVKYALSEPNAGQITVRITQEDASVCLEFRDNGPGYPKEVLHLQHHNVGMYLVQTLVRQDLEGELTLRNDQGAITHIRFKPAE